MGKLGIKRQWLNPLGWHLLQCYTRPDLRYIIMYGGSSSGKSYSAAQTLLMQTALERCDTLVMRKVGASIGNTIYKDFKVAAKELGIEELFEFKDGLRKIVHVDSGATIDFRGLDDPEKIKGIAGYKRLFLDELSEFAHEDYMQLCLRLRGREGQQIIAAFNPIKETHWIKREIFDKDTWESASMDVTLGGCSVPSELTKVKSLRRNVPREMLDLRTGEMYMHASDTIVLQTTYLNNFWVVGSPCGTYGYYDEQCIASFDRDRKFNPDYYNVYALGEWGVIKTGSEFFGSFNRATHVGKAEYNPALPLHICVDSNVLPYITITYWQLDTDNGRQLRQIGETCAESPNNSVRKSAKLVASELNKMAYSATLYVHGDASTKAANNIDDAKRSFLDLFIDTLQKEGYEVQDCVGTRNPNVAMSGEFINAVFDGTIDGVGITISDGCQRSIEDYQSVQKDDNGAIAKKRVKNRNTGQSYEEYGHISDTFRYVAVDLLRDAFTEFSNRRKRNLFAKDGAIQFYNADIKYVYADSLFYLLPNINGNAAYVHGKRVGNYWHIIAAGILETQSTDAIKAVIKEEQPSNIIVECGNAYYGFIRELREEWESVKARKPVDNVQPRIAATSDAVRMLLRFSLAQMDSDSGYAEFMGNMLDYGRDPDKIEASAVISGFVQYAIKLANS